MSAPVCFEMFRRKPGRHVAHLISSICGYRETAIGRFTQRETASLVVPLIINLGSPFRIALGRDPQPDDRQPSFAAGLYAGPVHIESDGMAECVQVDFTPLGAYRFFGSTIVDLTARMIDIDDLLGRGGRSLRQRLGEAVDWMERLDMMEMFLAGRADCEPSSEIQFAYRELARTAGRIRISRLATEIGWSRKHFVHRFSAEIGMNPKTIARMIRFHRACRLARQTSGCGWAGIAAEAGYAD